MRILCNLPLECFEARDDYRDIDLLTYGPQDRMMVDGTHYPFDIAFDPSRGTWHELLQRLPPGWKPDLVLIWWPDQEPLPLGLEQCDAPVVGVISDYNLTLPHLTGLWPYFDVLLCDRAGVELFRNLSFADVRWFCQYTFKRPFHRCDNRGERHIDIGFAGNLNPAVQRERAPWIERVRRLGDRGIAAAVRSGLQGHVYGAFLNNCRIGWNRSIRGEMNLRAFEVPACGALLMIERDNLEVRDFLTPGEECVLYGDDDFEDVVAALLADEPRRARIAMAGHERIQRYSMGHRLRELVQLLQQRGPGRPTATAAEAALGRATAMLCTWARGPELAAAALHACKLAPDDPRALNVLALANLRWRGNDGLVSALELFDKACAIDAGYLAAAVNLHSLFAIANRPDLQRRAGAELARRANRPVAWHDIDGPMLPLGFAPVTIDRSLALQRAVRSGSPQALASSLAP